MWLREHAEIFGFLWEIWQEKKKDSGPQQDVTGLKPGWVLHQRKLLINTGELVGVAGVSCSRQPESSLSHPTPKELRVFLCEKQTSYPSSAAKLSFGSRHPMPSITINITITTAAVTPLQSQSMPEGRHTAVLTGSCPMDSSGWLQSQNVSLFLSF